MKLYIFFNKGNTYYAQKHTRTFIMCVEKKCAMKNKPPKNLEKDTYTRQIINDSDIERENKRGQLYFILYSSLLF